VNAYEASYLLLRRSRSSLGKSTADDAIDLVERDFLATAIKGRKHFVLKGVQCGLLFRTQTSGFGTIAKRPNLKLLDQTLGYRFHGNLLI
jgi:hypothetical protein